MNPNYKIFIALSVLTLVSLACGLTVSLPDDAIDVGPVVTDQISISPPDPSETTDLTINFGAGELNLHPGFGSALLDGTASYNIEEFKPQVTTIGNDVELQQGTFEYEIIGLPNFGDLENKWDFQIGSFPINLEIRAGAFEGNFEFGGLAIHELRVFGGASSVDLKFSSPNLVPMSTFHFTSGITNAKLSGLANANFSLMEFKGGGGNYTLDFSGGLQRDATVEIDAGLSNITLIVPAGTPTILNSDSSLANIDAEGLWVGGGTTYSLSGNGPTLIININLGAGNITLSN